MVEEIALNGIRTRDEHPDVPLTPCEVAADAGACFAAGATVAHIHARCSDGTWSADSAWYAEAIRAVRTRVPGMIVSLTSIRPEGQPLGRATEMPDRRASDAATRPGAISINLGHVVSWELAGDGRRTVHYPNAYEDVVAVLRAFRWHGIVPELGIMDLGFVSNAVALADDGELPERPWCLVELDSRRFGSGTQVAPTTVESYVAVSRALASCFPAARWAAHGSGRGTFPVVEAALAAGQHARVGLEDTVLGPSGHSMGNVE